MPPASKIMPRLALEKKARKPWNRPKEPRTMNIASPFVVVPVILAVFTAAILFATRSKQDGDSGH